jgi:hypothetical protein
MEKLKRQERPRLSRYFLLPVVCLAGAMLNNVYGACFGRLLHLSIFMDTLFTVAIVFSWGLWPGILCGILTNLISVRSQGLTWPMAAFALCSVAAALTARLFTQLFPDELGNLRLFRKTPGKPPDPLGLINVLFIFSLVLCAVESVGGGLCAAFLETVYPDANLFGPSAENWFKLGLLQQNIPLGIVEIIARIPVNIIDRILTVFGAWVVARGVKAAAGMRGKC